MTAFGHWDTDLRSDPFNLVPTGQLAAAGSPRLIRVTFTAPRRSRETVSTSSCTGSMLPYAHGEGGPT